MIAGKKNGAPRDNPFGESYHARSKKGIPKYKLPNAVGVCFYVHIVFGWAPTDRREELQLRERKQGGEIEDGARMS